MKLKPYMGLVPFDDAGNAMRVVDCWNEEEADWRPADPFHATLEFWGDAYYAPDRRNNHWGMGNCLVLRHAATHHLYSIGLHTFAALAPQAQHAYPRRLLPWAMEPENPLSAALRWADYTPGPAPVEAWFPKDGEDDWWCYSWTGTWAWHRRGTAYGIFLLRRDPYEQDQTGPV